MWGGTCGGDLGAFIVKAMTEATNASSSETVLILGASDGPDRYAHRAQRLLLEHGHRVIPVHPRLKSVEGLPVIARLEDVEDPVDTVTLYVNPSIGEQEAEALIALKPRRVIFNPGTESDKLEEALRAAGIETERACTLVLLGTGQFV